MRNNFSFLADFWAYIAFIMLLYFTRDKILYIIRKCRYETLAEKFSETT